MSRIFIIVISFLFALPVQALMLGGTVDFYDDPENYLGLSGVEIGQTATANFSLNSLTPDFISDGGAPVFKSYIFVASLSGGGSGEIFINEYQVMGELLGVLIGVTNNYDFGDSVGVLDNYVFQLDFLPPSGYTQFSWSIVLSDSTASVLGDAELFALDSTAGWDSARIVASVFNANALNEADRSRELLRASLDLTPTPVPLPGAFYLFLCALCGLKGLKKYCC